MPTKHKQLFSSHPALKEAWESGRKDMTRRVVKMNLLVPSRDKYRIVAVRRDESGSVVVEMAYHDQNDRARFFVTCPHKIGDIGTIEHCDGLFRIVSIDAEPLQAISEEHAIREGAKFIGYVYSHPFGRSFPATRAFRQVWAQLYPSGAKSWDANPMTWLVGFEYAGEVRDG